MDVSNRLLNDNSDKIGNIDHKVNLIVVRDIDNFSQIL